MGAFRSQLRADSKFSLNLWKNENIEGYNRWDLIGYGRLLEHYSKKQYADISE